MATVYKRNSTYWIRFQWRGNEVRAIRPHLRRRPLHSSCSPSFLMSIAGSTAVVVPAAPTRKPRFSHDYLPTLKPTKAGAYTLAASAHSRPRTIQRHFRPFLWLSEPPLWFIVTATNRTAVSPE